MKYPSGQKVAVGDRVRLWSDQLATIVCSIDTREFTPDYPEDEWAYLGSGVVVKTDSGEVFHCAEPDEDFELVKPATAP